MQFLTIIAAIVSVTSAVSLQGRQGPPDCAQGCIANADLHGCPQDANLNACLCKNNDFVAEEAQCFQTSCTDPAQLQAALSFSDQLCRFAGVTITSLPTITSNSGSAASSATSTATSPSSTAPPPAQSSTSTGNTAASHFVSGKSVAVMAAVAAIFAL